MDFSVRQIKSTCFLSYLVSQSYALSQLLPPTYVTGALQVAIIRISGIVAGGLVSLLMAVFILPRSANIEACRELKKALKLLVDLNTEVWKHTSAPVPQQQQQQGK
jgi:hypothetical protein